MNALPNFDTIIQLHQAGKLEEARAAYLQFLQAEPQHVEALVALATLYLQRGELSDSAHYFQAALRYQPRHVRALHHYALCLKQQNLYEPALAQLDLALTVDPQFELAYKIKFSWLASLGRHAERLQGLRQALQHLPQAYEFELQLIAGLREANENAQALAHIDHVLAYQAAISLQPGYANAHGNLGTAYLALAQYENALASFDSALQLNPETHGARNNRANALQNLHRFDDALRAYDDILSRDVHDNATALKGWRLYEWRWQTSQLDSSRRSQPQPLWSGAQRIAGKRILIYAEQGLGDTLQFSRFISALKTLGAEVLFEVQPGLLPLLRSLPVVLYALGTAPQDVDFQCPLLSLPHALKLTLTKIPNSVPYLQVEADQQQAWRQKLAPYLTQPTLKKRKKIGLVWAGSAKHPNDAQRSIPFALFNKLFQHDADYFVLQKELSQTDRRTLQMWQRFGKTIVTLDAELRDFSDTAAVMLELDLIISVDTSVAHLAGALAKPVYLMLPYEPDFRWMLDRSDSPWYPTMTLFRQQQAGDWLAPLAQMQRQLTRLLQ